MNLGHYGKTVTALVTGIIGWCTQVANAPGGFDHITAVQWVALATVVAVALGVYAVANVPAPAVPSGLDHNPVPPLEDAPLAAPLPAETARARKR